MNNKFSWLKESLNTKEVTDKEIEEYLKYLKTEASSGDNLSEDALLEEKLAALVKLDILSTNTENKAKIEEIKTVVREFSIFKDSRSVADALKELDCEDKTKTLAPQYSRVKNFSEGKGKDKLETIYKWALFFAELLGKKPEEARKDITDIDIYFYLIDKKVCRKVDSNKDSIPRITGSYLLFRRANMDKESINISCLNLVFEEKTGVFRFEFIRRTNEGKETKTKGVLLRNTKDTFIFLCLSKKEKELYSFIETMTILKNPPLEEGAKDDYILGLYNGITVSGVTRRAFSSKVVLNRFNDSELLAELNQRNLLRSHKIADITEEYKKIQDVASYESPLWAHTLRKINEIISIDVMLEKTKNEIDSEKNIFFLRG